MGIPNTKEPRQPMAYIEIRTDPITQATIHYLKTNNIHLTGPEWGTSDYTAQWLGSTAPIAVILHFHDDKVTVSRHGTDDTTHHYHAHPNYPHSILQAIHTIIRRHDGSHPEPLWLEPTEPPSQWSNGATDKIEPPSHW